MTRPLINVPKTARRGELVEIKTLVSHPMESGYRPGLNGQIIPRDIISSFVCLHDGKEIFRATLSPAIAANPFLSFFWVATTSGTLTFQWTGDNGFSVSESVDIAVE
ncbi:thiosulfate oxidation carrier complex protein SoxZ [Telmatospirillum sp.]|uniref:thiosulfate oxidation carrier complex protein SoxZ n=1 Tax=Telmatospirillum sp. TaxID=2079197 RepID=UPI00283FC0E0|nr:thiosulfate oxidation carrier complex protein SoxZ [Telmatospirillum sp.]MDR3435518.1 thiosulfate oxidation carrier complex protein SoxZ [Telmatospirillum sp.]